MKLLKSIGRPETRCHYKLIFEGSIILSLLIIILAFKFFPVIKSGKIEYTVPQELFTVEDIQQTKHETSPPPPPKPSMIIESVTEAEIEDIEFSSTEIDINEEISTPPSPLPKEEKKRIIEEEF